MESHDINEAASLLPKLVAAAMRGEEVIITCAGTPAVKLAPTEPKMVRPAPGLWKGRVVEIDPDWWKPDDELADLFGIPKLSEAEGEPPKP